MEIKHTASWSITAFILAIIMTAFVSACHSSQPATDGHSSEKSHKAKQKKKSAYGGVFVQGGIGISRF